MDANLAACFSYPHRDHTGCPSSVECTAATPGDLDVLAGAAALDEAGSRPLPEPVRVPASGLRTGDVVETHGMRVLLDGPIREFTHPGEDLPVYACRGRVLNAGQVAEAGTVPMGWLYDTEEERAAGVPRWTVQSNDRRTWTVVARAEQKATRVARCHVCDRTMRTGAEVFEPLCRDCAPTFDATGDEA